MFETFAVVIVLASGTPYQRTFRFPVPAQTLEQCRRDFENPPGAWWTLIEGVETKCERDPPA